MRPGVRRQPTRRVVLAFLLILCVPHPSLAQSTRAVGREAALGLRFEELSFHPPMAQKKSMASGVTVFVLEDHTLPLATLYARFREDTPSSPEANTPRPPPFQVSFATAAPPPFPRTRWSPSWISMPFRRDSAEVVKTRSVA